MSFLEELKRQANDLQAAKSIDQNALARNTALAEAAATEASETVECEFAPHEVGQRRLDGLARWCLGHPHQFLDRASEVHRVEPR